MPTICNCLKVVGCLSPWLRLRAEGCQGRGRPQAGQRAVGVQKHEEAGWARSSDQPGGEGPTERCWEMGLKATRYSRRGSCLTPCLLPGSKGRRMQQYETCTLLGRLCPSWEWGCACSK